MKKIAFISASIIFLMVSFYVLSPGFRRLSDLNARVTRLKAAKLHLEKENRKLTATVLALESDPLYIEMRARKKLGLKKPGEIIYRVRPSRHQGSGVSSESLSHHSSKELDAARSESPTH